MITANETRNPLLLEVKNLKVWFEIKQKKQWFWQPAVNLKAVDGVSFKLHQGETLGVVGESGCGKSTLARAVIGLVKATEGSICWMGKELAGANAAEWQKARGISR
ncbi:Methionine import ATP-binding protein MetN [Tatumella ptyseos]|uniref:Methionine import ATP-binding protein MetN n=1 Tax=Tatumella ptyseos TaxID=82987 RepID=A0A2X5PP11_9GAMM|nr:Methionine import ATP-binding protein MetN [Tatumella ptyseos]